MFFLLGIILFLVLPSPWSWIALVACPLLGVLEVTLVWRHVRKPAAKVGVETLIGQRATVVSPCRPLGQVAIAGERWEARCDAGADLDELVTVVGRDGLVLRVEPDR